MDQKTGIGSLYDGFSRGYGAEIRLFRPDFRPNSTYKQSYTTTQIIRPRWSYLGFWRFWTIKVTSVPSLLSNLFGRSLRLKHHSRVSPSTFQIPL
jgi:hypothetical protein